MSGHRKAVFAAFALRTAFKLVRGLRQGLSEDERYRVADDVVKQLEGGRLAAFGRIAERPYGPFDADNRKDARIA